MKIEMELKDRPRGRAMEKICIDKSIHKKATIHALVSTVVRHRAWVKIIDIRVDLHGGNND